MTPSRGLRARGPRAAAKAAGAVRYQSGLQCKNGHTSERLTSNGSCLECVSLVKSERDKKHYQKHGEKIRERSRLWHVNNPEKAKIASSKKHFENRNAELVRMRARYALHREADMERKRLHYRANAKVLNAKNRERYRRNPSVWTVASRNRKARQRAAIGTHSVADIQDIFTAQRGRCAYCRVNIQRGWHVDHIQPLSKGGSNDRRNLQLTCASCNLQKRAHDPIYYAQRLGRLL